MADRVASGRKTTVRWERTSPIVYDHFPRSVMWLGITQVVCGVTMLVIGIVSIVMGKIGGVYGFTGLVWVILAGSFGMAAGSRKSICQIITTMTMSIIAAISSGFIAIAMAFFLYMIHLTASIEQSFGNQYSMEQPSRASTIFSSSFDVCVILLVVSLVEMIVSIVSSAIACHFSCFCCRNCCCKFDMTSTEEVTMFDVQPEQQMQVIGYSESAYYGGQNPAAVAVTMTTTPALANPVGDAYYQPVAAGAVSAQHGTPRWGQPKYSRLLDA